MSSLTFRTVGGSIYEVEYATNKVRRLSNSARAPTPRQGPDGEWREAMGIHPEQPIVGLPVLIHWKMNEDDSMNCTQTSIVTEVTNA
jgi:hypothetical protein